MILAGCETDKGKIRANNEDYCLVMPRQQIYVVADGVGGHKAGEVASKMAVEKVKELLSKSTLDEAVTDQQIEDILRECILQGNQCVRTLGEENIQNKGMATTLVVCYIRRNKVYVANVGDSRAYIYRWGDLFQITEDHTRVNHLIKEGKITRAEGEVHEDKHMITRALGAEDTVEADFYQTDVSDGDVLLLCTDGLHGELSEEEIKAIMKKEITMTLMAKQLVAAANCAGGYDNITAICLKVTGGNPHE